jgi:prephenate dehydrogenase
MSERRITVIGGGLIGGSICLGLKGARPEVEIACLDRSQRLEAIAAAGVADLIDPVERVGDLVPGSELVVLAVPVSAIPGELERLAPHLRRGAVVTDVGGTKAWIMERARELLPTGARFVGGHPVAGSERSGVSAADPLIFRGRSWVLCPYPDTPIEAMLEVTALVQDLLAVPVTLEAEEHDQLLAMTSHAPQLLALALVGAADVADAGHGLLDLLVGRGFLDMTRIAASDYSVWEGVVSTNHDAIRDALTRVRQSLAELTDALDAGELGPLWDQASRRRRALSGDAPPRVRGADLRERIDGCDERLLSALGERMRAVRAMGRLKRDARTPVPDPDRERRMLEQRLAWGRALELPPALVESLFGLIIEQSRRAQQELKR